MFYNNSTKKVAGKGVNILTVLLGILCGCFYASVSRSGTMTETFISRKQTESVVITEMNETAQFLVFDDTSIADSLAQSVRVLCWIHVDSLNQERTKAIRRTWGARCTSFIAITSSGNNSTNHFNIPKGQNRMSSTENAYRFIHNTFGDKFDWFLRADDRSYVVVENLRYKLYAYDPLEPIGIGLTLKNAKNQVYFSEKAGYVLSKIAVEKLVNGFKNRTRICIGTYQNESQEVQFGQCLKEVGIVFGRSTDDQGKQLFIDKKLDEFFLPKIEVHFPYPWYHDYEINQYLDAASDYTITFLCMTWQQMHVVDFLIYKLRPYGLKTITPSLPSRLSVLKMQH